MEQADEPGGTLLLLLDNSVYSLNEDQAHDQTRLEAMCNTARLVAADAQPQGVGVITLTSSGKPRPYLALPISYQWAGKSGTLTSLSHRTLEPHNTYTYGEKDGDSVSNTLQRILGALKLAALSMRGAPKTTARHVVLLLCSPASVPRDESHTRLDVEALTQAVQSILDMGASFKVIAFGDATNDTHADGLHWLEQLCSMESSSLPGPVSSPPSSQSISHGHRNVTTSSASPSAAMRMPVGKGPMGHPDPFGLWGDADSGSVTPSKHSRNLLVVASPTREQLVGGLRQTRTSPGASSSSAQDHAGDTEKSKGLATEEPAPTLSAGDDASAEKPTADSSARVAEAEAPCASATSSASTPAAMAESGVLEVQRPVALEKSLADSRLLTTSIESILKQCWDATYEAQITFPLVEMDEDPEEPPPMPIRFVPNHKSAVPPTEMRPAKLKARVFGSKPPWMEEGYMSGIMQETPLPDVIPLSTKLADALVAPRGSPAACLAPSSSSSARRKEAPLALALPPVEGKEAVLVPLETMMNHLDNTQLRSLIEMCGTDTEDCKDRVALLRRAVDVIAIQQQAASKDARSPPGAYSPAAPATCTTRRGSMQKGASPLLPSAEKRPTGGWSSSKKAEVPDPLGPSGRWSQPPPSGSANSNLNSSPAAGRGGPGAATKSNMPPSRGDSPMLSLSSDCRMESRLTADYRIEQQMSVMIPGSRLSVTLDQVGAVTNALMTPLVQIRVGRLRRNRKQGGFRLLINDSSKGHLALHGLPNGDLQMRWTDEKGTADEEIAHVPMPRQKDEVLFEPVTTEPAEKACSIVSIDEDPSGRSFFVQRQKGVRHYFWIREVSISRGLELLAQMQAACDHPPSLAQRAGVSEHVVHNLGQMALALTSQRGSIMPPQGGSSDSNAPRRRRRSAPEEVYGQATRYGSLTGIEPVRSEYTPARSRGTTAQAAQVVAAMQQVRQAGLEDQEDDEYGYGAKMREMQRIHKERTQAREKQKAQERDQGPSTGLHKGFLGKASTSGKHKGSPRVVGQLIDKDPQPPRLAVGVAEPEPAEGLMCATVTATVTATATSTATCRRTGRELSATVNATAQAAAQAFAVSMEEAQQAAAKEAERLARAEAEKQAWGAAEKASKERMEVFALEQAAIEEDCDSKKRVDNRMERDKLAKELKDLRKKLDRERILEALPGSLPHWQFAPPGTLDQLAQDLQLTDLSEADMLRQRSVIYPSTPPASFLASTSVEHPDLVPNPTNKIEENSASAVAPFHVNDDDLDNDKFVNDPEGPSKLCVPATPSDIGSATPDSVRRRHAGRAIAPPSPWGGSMPAQQVSAQDQEMAETFGSSEFPKADLCTGSSPRMAASMPLQPLDVGTGMNPDPSVQSSSDSSSTAAQNLDTSSPASPTVSGKVNHYRIYRSRPTPPPGTRADLHSLREMLACTPTLTPSSLTPETVASMLQREEATIWSPVRERCTTTLQQPSEDVLCVQESSMNAAETSRSGKLCTRVKTAADVLARVAGVRDEMESEDENSPQQNRIQAAAEILVDDVAKAGRVSEQDETGKGIGNGDVIDTDATMDDEVPQKREVEPKVDVNNLTQLFSTFYRN